jgi:hypothetical protein
MVYFSRCRAIVLSIREVIVSNNHHKGGVDPIYTETERDVN